MAGGGFRAFEAIKRSMGRHSWFERLERYTSPHTHPGLGVWRLAGQKWRVLLVFVLRRLAQGPGRSAALTPLRGLAGHASGKEVLVIGSGPSAESVRAGEVAARQASGDLLVVATNFFLHTPLAKTITPDFLMWSDSVFRADRMESNDAAWQKLDQSPSVTVVSPWTWKPEVEKSGRGNRFVYFDDDTLEGWSGNISPLKPRGYQGSTGVKAVAFALHLRPSRVLVIGLDLSNYQHFSVDADNRLLRHPVHLSGADSGLQDISHNGINGLADALYSVANQFLALRRLFATQPIVNLNPNSLVDCFDKVREHPLVDSSPLLTQPASAKRKRR